MDKKVCVRCNEVKTRSDFFKVDWEKKFKPHCKKCTSYIKYYDIIPDEVYMYRMYNNQRSNARGRGMEIPTYSFEWFKEFLVQNGFNEKYQYYLDNNKNKDLAPSVDRINPNISYTEDNIQLITWRENHLKGAEDRMILEVRGGLTKVIHYIDNKHIIYNSILEASKELNLPDSHIYRSCTYELMNYPNGIFRYYKPNKDKVKELSKKLVKLLKAKATPHGNKGKMSDLQKQHLEDIKETHKQNHLRKVAEQGFDPKERLYKIWFRANREFNLQEDWKDYLKFKDWALRFGYNDTLNIYRKNLTEGFYEGNLGLRLVK